MSQSIWGTIIPSSTSGTQLATLLNDFKNAVTSGFSGVSRPTELDPGGYWVDMSLEGTPDFTWSYKMWTGSIDVTIYKINITTGVVTIAGSDSSFEISKVSADAVGALLTFQKERIANAGQVLTGDVIGQSNYVGAADDNSNPLVARAKVVASDDMTSVLSGAYFVWEAVTKGGTTLAEIFRAIDGKLAIGLTVPDVSLHVRGNGIKSERFLDDAIGAKFITKVKRVTGAGQTILNDILATFEHNSTDVAGTEAITAKIVVSATEAHTTTARGTIFSFQTIKKGTNTLRELLSIGDTVGIEGYQLNAQDVASTATIAALSALKAIVNLTGTTATIVQGIDATGASKVILIHNNSTQPLTLANQNGSATAANRFLFANSRDITVLPNTSIELFYSTADSRWKLKSGSGSGGGGALVAPASNTYAAPLTVNDGDTITPSAVDSRRLIHVVGGTLGAEGYATVGDIALTGDQLSELVIVSTSGDSAVAIKTQGNIQTEGGGDILLSAGMRAHLILSGTKWLAKG